MMTIKDIARECGCAVSTVSRVLNNHPGVSKETKQRILEIIEKNNFVPNSNAQKLKQQETKNIAIIVKGMQNMVFANMAESVEREIKKYGYFSLVQYLSEEDNEVLSTIDYCRASKPCGIVFLGGNIENFTKDFKKINVPSVLITTDATELTYENLMSVSVDDVIGGEMAIEYLAEKNHKNIAILGGDLVTSCVAELRYRGALSVLKKYDIGFHEEKQFVTTPFNYKDAYKATKRLYEQYPEVTAIFAMSDVMAIGAISAITDMGLKVPGDISVIGYDGIELGRYYYPKLTTIVQPQAEMSKIGVKKLMDALSYGGKKTDRLLVPELFEGKSVKAV